MDSEEEEAFLLLVLLNKKTKKKKINRKFWVHPLLEGRIAKGLFHTLYDDLIKDDGKFFMYFRMSRRSFDELLSMIQPIIRGTSTNMRLCIPADEKLALTLR
jgi:hypothetical protein